ncbi:MAG: oligosaccharide flippase family protein [Anaerolineae bacterium]|nr:oligosaccharide flippase family protein [Anaerolineae bacterium]
MIRLKQSKRLPDLGILALLLLLPLLLYAPAVLGPRTLLPADVLFLYEPHQADADALGVDFPQNHLVADLILENYVWKQVLVEALQEQELPLWDPYIFAGHPFLASGQHSALYPLSIVFYLLPLWRAYGVFAWLQLGLAGGFMYIFARVLGVRRLGSLIAGIAFQFSGFMAISSVPHPMIVAAASWLPLILAMVELVIQQRPALGKQPATLPWALLGAAALGCQMLAGHAENTGIALLVTGAYAAWRLVSQPASRQSNKRGLVSRLVGWFVHSRRAMIWLTAMLVLGLALGAVQFAPYFEVVGTSFRGGDAAASLQDVLGWAYPKLRVIAFGIPHFFGSPAHHRYFDLFDWRWKPAPTFPDGRYIDWGIKNYVEGGAYLGLLPLFLAVIAVISQFTKYQSTDLPGKQHTGKLIVGRLVNWSRHPHIPFFTLLALFSLGCIFGTPLYAIIYALPSFNQSHSPFRWIFPLTLCVATLAGFGIDAVTKSRELQEAKDKRRSLFANFCLLDARFALETLLAGLAFWGGTGTLVLLALSRLFFPQAEPIVEWIFRFFASRRETFSAAFPNHLAFYCYEFPWAALFGLLLAATGIVLRVSRCPIFLQRRPAWEILAVVVLVLDLVAWSAGFAPAVDPALLDHVPPVIKFLQQDTAIWRYASFTPHGAKTMNANVGMLYDLQSVDGYDSLFTDQYRDYMALIEPQGETPYNRIASFHKESSLYSPLTDLLNVKYVVTEFEIESYKYELVYEDDAVRVYENLGAMARAFTLPASATVETDDFGAAVQSYDPRSYVIIEIANRKSQTSNPATAVPQQVTGYANNEVFVDASVGEPSWLILADSYFPGWKAFVRPQGAGEESETEIQVHRVNGTFRGVQLEPGTWTVRFKYSPDSVKVGAFVSFIAGMAVLFLVGLYLWRFFYREEDDASTVKRVAKNSIAPIVLNLFIRAIEMGFAMLMARILGPAGNGRYAWAANAYLWLYTLADFGLEMYLIREAARDRSRAWPILINSTVLRLLLFVGVVPVLGGFLGGWQALISPLEADTTWAVILLYVGLLPGTLSNNLTALFRAYEKHEFPAAVQTATTIISVILRALALVSGLGIVGLAGATIVTNTATLLILAALAYRQVWPDLHRAHGNIEWSLQRAMVVASWPVMASTLLQTLFPIVNVLFLKPLQSDTAVGWYDAGYKWLNMLHVIPALFTYAVFPVLSRQAAQDRQDMQRSYRLAIKLLVMLALPMATLFTLLAEPLVGFLSGSAFLPHGAIALQILVWSTVFGWINSLTNYALMALDRQRQVMLASAARVIFAVVMNLLLVRQFGYIASAGIIIGGELLLVILFYVDLRRQLGPVGWGKLLWRVTLAALLMGGAVWGISTVSLPLAFLAGVVIYPVALLLLRAITPQERAALVPLLPEPLRSRLT